MNTVQKIPWWWEGGGGKCEKIECVGNVGMQTTKRKVSLRIGKLTVFDSD